jgi:hypothetical protein
MFATARDLRDTPGGDTVGGRVCDFQFWRAHDLAIIKTHFPAKPENQRVRERRPSPSPLSREGYIKNLPRISDRLRSLIPKLAKTRFPSNQLHLTPPPPLVAEQPWLRTSPPLGTPCGRPIGAEELEQKYFDEYGPARVKIDFIQHLPSEIAPFLKPEPTTPTAHTQTQLRIANTSGRFCCAIHTAAGRRVLQARFAFPTRA